MYIIFNIIYRLHLSSCIMICNQWSFKMVIKNFQTLNWHGSGWIAPIDKWNDHAGMMITVIRGKNEHHNRSIRFNTWWTRNGHMFGDGSWGCCHQYQQNCMQIQSKDICCFSNELGDGHCRPDSVFNRLSLKDQRDWKRGIRPALNIAFQRWWDWTRWRRLNRTRWGRLMELSLPSVNSHDRHVSVISIRVGPWMSSA